MKVKALKLGQIHRHKGREPETASLASSPRQHGDMLEAEGFKIANGESDPYSKLYKKGNHQVHIMHALHDDYKGTTIGAYHYGRRVSLRKHKTTSALRKHLVHHKIIKEV